MNLPYESSMYLSNSIAFSLFGKSLRCVASLVLFCSLAGEVRASCGDYLEHSTAEEVISSDAADLLPAPPYSPSCRSGQCHKQPAAPPTERNNKRLVVRQIDGICSQASSMIELKRILWTVSDCHCPRSGGREVLLRPPIA